MVFIVLFLVLIIIVAIIAGVSDKNDKDDKLSDYASQGYNFENKMEINRYTFAVDKTKEKLLIIKPLSTTPINQQREFLLNFSDITGFEVNRNGETITKASLGAPIVGGLVFGVAGAIVGSLLGNRKSKEKLKVDIIIQLNSFDTPIMKIPMVDNNDFEINKKHALQELEKLCVWFKLILDKNESKTANK